MALQEDFEKKGNWLFRHRSRLPLVVVILLLSMRKCNFPGQSETMDHVQEVIYVLVIFLVWVSGY